VAYLSSESRYRQSSTYLSDSGRLVLLERQPWRFEDREDNLFHVSSVADAWWTIAEQYYGHISDRACGLWWVVFDYQTPALVDPTLKIRPNTLIVLPSPGVVVGEVQGAQALLYQ